MNRHSTGSGWAAACRRAVAWALMGAWGAAAHAGLGFTQLAATEHDGPLSVYYPTLAAEAPPSPARLSLALAVDAEPARGNGGASAASVG